MTEMTATIPQALIDMGRRMLSQNNECTADPVFAVMENVRIGGMDSEFAEDFIFYDMENCCEADREEHEKLLADWNETGDVPSPWIKGHYIKKSIPVQWFFTRSAAENFIESNGHRHRYPLTVFVDWGGRNPEWKAVREFLLNIAKTKEGASDE